MISSQLSACPGKTEPFKDHPGTHGHLTGLRNISRLIILWQYYTGGELVYGFSYQILLKNVPPALKDGFGKSGHIYVTI